MNLFNTVFLLKKQVPLLFKGVRIKAYIALGLIIFSGVTEGASLLLIVPLLGIAGVNHVQFSENKLILFIKSIFETTGVSLSVVNVLIIYVMIMSFYALIRYFQAINTTTINQNIVVNWRNFIFRKLSYASWSSIQNLRQSDIQNTLTLEIQKFGSISNQLIQLMGTLVLIIVYLCVSAMLSTELTLLALFPVVLMALMNRPINKKSFSLGKSSVGFNQQLQSIILEQLAALKLVKTYGKEQKHLDEFEDTNKALEGKILAFTKATQSTKTIVEIIAAIVIAVYIYVAIVVFETAITELLLLIFIFARLLPKASKLVGNYQQILNNLPAIEWTNKVIDQLEEEEQKHKNINERIILKKGIEFKAVDFSYGSKKILEKLSFMISTKQTTVIRGGSGVGKSTTIDLIMGLQKLDSGVILIDDQPVEELNALSWKASIAYVPQDAFLFHKSIKENLLWADPLADESAIWNALEQAGAMDFIKRFSEGLQTVVGDRGMQISGGERQRIALARALLRQPELLILDEATSAVDDQNERIIKEALGKLHGKMTIVIVAHRSLLVELADQVIELK